MAPVLLLPVSVESVNGVPAVDALINNSLTPRPAEAVTPSVVLALIKVTKSSRIACAFVVTLEVNVVPLIVTEKVSDDPIDPLIVTASVWATGAATIARVLVLNTD